MAEGLAALGIASSVLQIVDFGTKLVRNTYRLASSPSGALSGALDYENFAQEQITMVKRLHDALVANPVLDDNERCAVTLAEQCKDESIRTLEIIERLKVPAGKRGVKKLAHSASVALNIQKELEKIKEHRENLQLINGQLATALLSVLRTQNEKKSTEIQNLLVSDRTDIVAAVLELRNDLRTYNDKRERNHQKRLWKIIHSLQFPDMQLRQHSIPEAFPDTYGWALQKDAAGLKTWLRAGSNIYWVSGKAGSGKSTFMKFLGKDPRTHSLLSEWSRGLSRLLVIECFFWYAGSRLQKSIEGLLRSMLYHILDAYPGLVPVLFPARWARIQSNMDGVQDLWSRSELQIALQDVSQVIGDVYGNKKPWAPPKFCVFIDGLDEYSGNHGELIRTLENFACGEHTKLCVSSRPWHVFTTAFELHKPHLSLQDLTREDIKHYVGSSIQKALTWSRSLGSADASDADVQELSLEIVNRAEGVFLWVHLVLQSVLHGLDEGDHITTLRQRVLEFPQDLEDYFDVMLTRVDSVHRHHTIQSLYLAYLYVEDVEAADHSSFLDFELLRRSASGLMDPIYLWDLEPQTLTIDGFLKLAERARSFLGACCKDLLILPFARQDATAFSVDPSRLKVQFLHRTVYDYLRTTNRIQSFSEQVPPCLRDGSGFHLLNMAKLKFHLKVMLIESEYFCRQAAFSLDRPWAGLSVEFLGQLQRVQPLHQTAGCASIGAALIAFEQYDTFRAMCSAASFERDVVTSETESNVLWILSRPFQQRFELPMQEELGASWPHLPLLAAVLGMAPCREFSLAAVNANMLTYILRNRTQAPSKTDRDLGEKILLMFLESALPPFLDAGNNPLGIRWANPAADLWTVEPPGCADKHMHRILLAIHKDGPPEWAEGVRALFRRTQGSPQCGTVYQHLEEAYRRKYPTGEVRENCREMSGVRRRRSVVPFWMRSDQSF